MVRISTRYDKDIKKKVFIVRGDEAYARQTKSELILGSTTTDGRMKGFAKPITVNLYNTYGSGTVTIYDNDTAIYSRPITSSVTTFTVNDKYLAYGYSHTLYCKYSGSDYCLPNKSRKVSITVPVPDDLKVVITRNNTSTTQINHGANIPINVTATIDDEPVADDTEVLVYVDGEYKTTLTTTSGVATGNISGIADGKHSVMCVVEDGISVYGGSLTYDINIGYKVYILSYPNPFVTNLTNKATVQVTDYDDNPISGGTVSINSYSGTTNSDGIATITISSYINGQYYATYSDGSVSSNVASSTITVTGILLQGSSYPAQTVPNQTWQYNIVASATNKSNVPVTITHKKCTGSNLATETTLSTQTLVTDTNGIVRANTIDAGTNGGLMKCIATVDNITSPILYVYDYCTNVSRTTDGVEMVAGYKGMGGYTKSTKDNGYICYNLPISNNICCEIAVTPLANNFNGSLRIGTSTSTSDSIDFNTSTNFVDDTIYSFRLVNNVLYVYYMNNDGTYTYVTSKNVTSTGKFYITFTKGSQTIGYINMNAYGI